MSFSCFVVVKLVLDLGDSRIRDDLFMPGKNDKKIIIDKACDEKSLIIQVIHGNKESNEVIC